MDDLKVGDFVKVRMGGAEIEGVIIEDRGHLGVQGRRLWRVEIPSDLTGSPLVIELPEEELRKITERQRQRGLSRRTREMLRIAARAGGEFSIHEVDQLPGPWVRAGRGVGQVDILDETDPRVAAKGLETLSELRDAGLVVSTGRNLYTLTERGFEEAKHPGSLELTWHLCLGAEGGHWCDLLNESFDPQTLSGVYVVWHGQGGPSPGNVLMVGRGLIATELPKLKKNQELLRFAEKGVYITWASVYGPRQAGVEAFLADKLEPRLVGSIPSVDRIFVNLP